MILNRCDQHIDSDLLVVCTHLARAESHSWIPDVCGSWLCPACATSVESLTEFPLVTLCRECAAEVRNKSTAK